MNKKKMIEEMANIIDERLIEANNVLGSMNKGKGYWLAQKLVEYYQPKLPEGAVVFEQKDLTKLQRVITQNYNSKFDVDLVNYLTNTVQEQEQKLKQVRKETAKEFATTLISVLWEEEKDEKIRIKDVHGVIRDILDSEYGVKWKRR